MIYKVKKVNHPHDIVTSVPGSKSITNRALLIAELASGRSVLKGCLFSDDSRHFIDALIRLGFPVLVDEDKREITITGFGGRIPKNEAEIDVGSAGTAARFLTALLGLSKGRYHIVSSEQMKKRPMKDLLVSLEKLGTHIEYDENEYHFPFTIGNTGEYADTVDINVDKSSQFLSALLISAIVMEKNFTINVTGTHGMAYVEMTRLMMKQFGLDVMQDKKNNSFIIPKKAAYESLDYDIEPDVSAACYFYAMSPLLHVKSKVMGVHQNSLQGDVAFLDVLVCNAGVCVLEDFLEDDTFENRDLHLDINVKGAWNVAKAVIPSMIANGGGAIVVTSSVTGDMVADPGEVAYATSKAALVGFTKALAREFADKNIRVNAICPGYVRTPLVEGMAKQSDPENPERAIQAIADAVPLKRLADPEEVGELAAFLGCYESSYITGTQIVIDGGSTLPETTSMGQ